MEACVCCDQRCGPVNDYTLCGKDGPGLFTVLAILADY